MLTHTPRRNVLTYPPQHPPGPLYLQPESVWYTSRRFRIFIITFLISCLVGLFYVYQRPAIYQSKTTLLTVAPAAVDQLAQEVYIQHVAIEGNMLTGYKLIEATREALFARTSIEISSVPALREMLFIAPVPDTNLVELKAEGEVSQFLPLLLNTLTEQYQLYRQQQISRETGETALALQEQYEMLSAKVAQKRDELDSFRIEHNILSIGRDENQVLAWLKGLSESLNRAGEAQVNAKARLDAVQGAIRKGQPVVPDTDKRSLANLEGRAQELREQLSELDRRYTRDYLALQPSLKVIPEQLEKLEQTIRNKKQEGQNIVLTDAEQAYYAARQATVELKQQIEDYKQTATEFTRRFAEHEALIEELTLLETTYREIQGRLTQIEVVNREKYPQVKVVEPAYESRHSIRPNYARDTGLTLLLSLLLGLITIWFFEFFKYEKKLEGAGVASWSRIMTRDEPALNIEHQAAPQLGQSSPLALEAQSSLELAVTGIEQLFGAANNAGKFVIASLLAGLTLDETVECSPGQVDFNAQKLNLIGPEARTISLSPLFLGLLAKPGLQPSKPSEAEALITCAAFDSGLPNPATINSSAIRHAYITYLVRQGLRLSALEQIIGPISAQQLAGYASYSPEGVGKTVEEINQIYPAMVSG